MSGLEREWDLTHSVGGAQQRTDVAGSLTGIGALSRFSCTVSPHASLDTDVQQHLSFLSFF
jgi:hypothetical protein